MNRYLYASLILLGSTTITAYGHVSPKMQYHSKDVRPDARIEVAFPPLLKRQTLATMRMHLQGLSEVQQALADKKFEKAAEIATMTLGMSSMHGNQMPEESKYMPQGMRKLGALMHQRAAKFAISAQNAAATGDVRLPLRALSRVTQTCVACHSVYRLK